MMNQYRTLGNSMITIALFPSLVASANTSSIDQAFNKQNPAPFSLSRFSTTDSNGQHHTNDGAVVSYAIPTKGHIFHIGSMLANDEQRYDVGLSSKPIAISLFAGRGESYGRLDQNQAGLDPFFFHGGSTDSFGYRGAAMDLAVHRNVGLQFAMSTVKAKGLDDRDTLYAGVDSRRYGAGLFKVNRDNSRVATGISFFLGGNTTRTTIRQFDHQSGARYRTLNLTHQARHNRWFELAFQSGRNPLFHAKDVSRLVFRFGGVTGQPVRHINAEQTVENGGPTEETAGTSSRTRGLGGLAGSLVAVGLTSSSGDKNKDESVRLSAQDNAGRTILNSINPTSVRQNREFGGWVYRNGDGTYGFTRPVAGTIDSVDIGPKSVVPGGTLATASYHTHGGPDPRYDNEHFSSADIMSDTIQQVDGYLGTPAGRFLHHDLESRSIYLIGNINH
ncbi:MAG: hypothetical protein DHS20C01_17900 [marine bacterium B5-7]|nr:MAG: hypothetical protein DHS20C01_17900 [marine bacterium B5-7]